MKYTLLDVVNGLENCINNDRLDVGFAENGLAKYYEIPVLSENKIITVVENKPTNKLFFYCNGKTIRPDEQDSESVKNLHMAKINDYFDVLKSPIVSQKILDRLDLLMDYYVVS